MKRVRNKYGERIAKNSGRFCERNAVLAFINLGFGVIPLKTKFHPAIIADKRAKYLRTVQGTPGGFDGGA